MWANLRAGRISCVSLGYPGDLEWWDGDEGPMDVRDNEFICSHGGWIQKTRVSLAILIARKEERNACGLWPASLHPSFYTLCWTGRTPFPLKSGQLSAFSESLPKTWKFLRIENSQVVVSLRERQLAEDWSQRCSEAKVYQGGSWTCYSEMSFCVASGPCGLTKRGDPRPSWREPAGALT